MIISNLKKAFKQEVVDVPELGDGAQIIVREMSIDGLMTYQQSNFNDDGTAKADNPYAWMMSLIVHSTVNEDGEPLATQDDVPELMKVFPKGALDRLISVVTRLNKMTPTSVADEKNESAPVQENNS